MLFHHIEIDADESASSESKVVMKLKVTTKKDSECRPVK